MLGLLSVIPRLGGFSTCTVMFCVSEQPFNVPVKLYVVVTLGVAVTLACWWLDKPWLGCQLNCVAVPTAASWVLLPLVFRQILALLWLSVKLGKGLTMSVAWVLAVQLLTAVTVTW